ncbi:MAG TPA: hypothetical protein VKN18_31950 [Blastocatellia bacterium]|nr:hypothetical protein [Blastocatellia bacterium]
MKRNLSLILVALALSDVLYAQANLEIALKRGSKGELQTRDQLQRLIKTYDLAKWTFTRSILIDEEAIPHSHPVLTLSARHVKDDELLLSTFVHEQAHWFLTQNQKATEDAKKELRAIFPKVPIKPPEGASDEESTYLHLIVIYLEYRADRELMGELRARQIMEFWATDHYTWIYKTVLERPRDIGNIAFKYKLVPRVLG